MSCSRIMDPQWHCVDCGCRVEIQECDECSTSMLSCECTSFNTCGDDICEACANRHCEAFVPPEAS
jgi:hypothetical protein